MGVFDLTTFSVDLLRLGLAMALGALIGAEPTESNDVTRVVQGVAAGVGFLGAGTIIKMNGDQQIRGLTTASSI